MSARDHSRFRRGLAGVDAALPMPYLHCAHCNRTAWLHATQEPGARCRHCDAVLTEMPAGQARFLVSAVRERFALDAQQDGLRRRFLRSG
jgi:hypothetical protein